MIGLGVVYVLAGATFALFAALALVERRVANAAFHALLATSFVGGDRIGDTGNGVLVLALIAVTASGRMRRSDPEAAVPAPRGNGLFAVALLIPAVALAGTVAFKTWPGVVDPKQATLVALALGALVALAACYAWLRPGALQPFRSGRRLMDDIGWAAVLPQMLASLGAVFAAAGVGQVVGGLFGAAIPSGSLFAAVALYALGMAGFTIVMGNAFAAFPVMASAVAIPVLIRALWRDSGADRGARDARRLLRDAADADGGELQPRPRCAARPQGPLRRHPRAGADRGGAACVQHAAALGGAALGTRQNALSTSSLSSSESSPRSRSRLPPPPRLPPFSPFSSLVRLPS